MRLWPYSKCPSHCELRSPSCQALYREFRAETLSFPVTLFPGGGHWWWTFYFYTAMPSQFQTTNIINYMKRGKWDFRRHLQSSWSWLSSLGTQGRIWPTTNKATWHESLPGGNQRNEHRAALFLCFSNLAGDQTPGCQYSSGEFYARNQLPRVLTLCPGWLVTKGLQCLMQCLILQELSKCH